MNAFDTLTKKACPEWITLAQGTNSMVEKIQHIMDQIMPGHIGFILHKIDKDTAYGSIECRAEVANLLGYIHGGAIYATGDTLAGALMWSTTDGNFYAVTQKGSINYFHPVKTGRIHFYAEIITPIKQQLNPNGTKYKIDVECYDDKKHHIAKMEFDFVKHYIKKK